MYHWSGSNNVIPNATSFQYLASHASAVLGDWVYIDGGFTLYLDKANNEVGELLNVTLAIDLRSKWTNTSVSMVGIDKAGSPILNSACLWPNAQGSAAYTFGGGEDWGLYYGSNVQPVAPALWEFKPDNAGGGAWSPQNTGNTGFPVTRPTNGLQASGDGNGYYLGGFLNWGTYPKTSKGYMPVPNLIIYNSTANVWQNFTASGFAAAGTASYGGAQVVPTFGAEGLVVFFGGYVPTTNDLDYSSQQQGFNNIAVFDSHKQTWYHQNATGPIPEWRANFCNVGVQGANGTYEIFIYGGTADPISGSYWVNGSKPLYPDANKVQQELELDEIFVLSLPSFNWFKANYPATASRNSHTCHVVGAGQRQMLSIGGANFATAAYSNLSTSHQDIFARGLGVFDLTEMTWLSFYDPNAPSYQTPQIVKDYVNTSPTPSSWSSPQLAQLFSETRAISRPSASVSPSPYPSPSPSSTSTPIGAIAGGVVGGVLALGVLILIGWFFRRRQRHRHGGRRQQEMSRELYGDPNQADAISDAEPHELITKERPAELQTHGALEAWELRAKEQPRELYGDMNYRAQR